MKHFTLESGSLHSIRWRNSILVLKRPFFSAFRGPLSIDIPSLERCIPFTVYFYTFHTYVTSSTHFTLHLLSIHIARAEYFLIPDDAVDRRELGFWILLF